MSMCCLVTSATLEKCFAGIRRNFGTLHDLKDATFARKNESVDAEPLHTQKGKKLKIRAGPGYGVGLGGISINTLDI